MIYSHDLKNDLGCMLFIDGMTISAGGCILRVEIEILLRKGVFSLLHISLIKITRKRVLRSESLPVVNLTRGRGQPRSSPPGVASGGDTKAI